MDNWVLYPPEYIDATADRASSSRVAAYQAFATTISGNLSQWEVKFFLFDPKASAEPVFLVDGAWPIDLGSADKTEKPEAATLAMGLAGGATHAETATINASSGPFCLLLRSDAEEGKGAYVRMAVRRKR